MREDQRSCVRVLRPHVQEVHAQPVDLRRELREGDELPLQLPPVEPVPPVVDELLQVVDRNPSAPAVTGELRGPARLVEPGPQVVEVGLGTSMRNGVIVIAPTLFGI